MTQWTFTPGQPGTGVVQNMASWTISRHDQEPYQIDISWPLAWSSRKDDSVASANVVYLVDGNALFLTATEALRRRESHRPRETGTIVVAIGYPLDDSVFSPRRSFDLTPSCEQYTPPDGPDGKPKQEDHGGADKFLRFITEVVRPFIQEKIFPGVSFTKSGLFGHSYGGLFVLHTLFTRPGAFDAYLAASPSIWWNDRFVLSEAERFCAERGADTRPVLRLSFGSREQDPVGEPGEPLENFQKRQTAAQRRRMTDNCRDLHAQLLASQRLSLVEMREYPDEDHGSVIAPALNSAVTFLTTLPTFKQATT